MMQENYFLELSRHIRCALWRGFEGKLMVRIFRLWCWKILDRRRRSALLYGELSLEEEGGLQYVRVGDAINEKGSL